MKNYKTIWDNLSPTLSEARYTVGYLGEEDDIQSNGRITADFLQSVFEMKSTDKVLEIGCGIARIGRELASRCGEWHGSDISGNMIAFAHERTKDLPNVFLHELPEPDLSIFNDGYFDCVYSTIVFMHLDKVEMFNYIREAFRVLAPGGKFYCDTYNIVSPDGWQQFMNIVEMFSAVERPGHVSQFSTPPELEKFMTEAGFVDLEVDDRNESLVVSVGRKPEQKGFERPQDALNPEVIARVKAQEEARLAETPIEPEPIVEVEAAEDNGFSVKDGKAILDYENWVLISENMVAKDAYISQLEETLTRKERHISTLEKRIRKRDLIMRRFAVRLALRFSKPR